MTQRLVYAAAVSLAQGATGLALLAAGYFWLKVSARWFVVGGAIWLLGAIVLKSAAAWLGFKGLHALEPLVAPGAYVALLAVHSGLMTGLFEPGTTLVAGLKFRQLTAEPRRMIAIGIGAGGSEAIFGGTVALLSPLAALLHPATAGPIPSAPAMAAAFVVIERLLAAATHTGARVLVLSSISLRRPMLFVWSFVMMGGLDAFHAFVKAEHLYRGLTTLACVPPAIVSIFIVRWRLRVPSDLPSP